MTSVITFDVKQLGSPTYRAHWLKNCLLVPTLCHLNELEQQAVAKGQLIRLDLHWARIALVEIDDRWRDARVWNHRKPALQLVSDATEVGGTILLMNMHTAELVA